MNVGVWPYQIVSEEKERAYDLEISKFPSDSPEADRLFDEHRTICWKCGSLFKILGDGKKFLWNWHLLPNIDRNYSKPLESEVPTSCICDDCCKDLIPAVYKMQDILHTFYAINILQRTIQCQKKNDQQMKSKLLASCERCLSMLQKVF